MPETTIPAVLTNMRELIESLQRLERAALAIAVFNDGSFRVIHAGAYGQPASEHFTVWSPMDMFFYVLLPPEERRIFLSFKKLGGTMEWRSAA